MSFADKNSKASIIAEMINNLSDSDRAKLGEIISDLRKDGIDNIESLVLIVIEKMLSHFAADSNIAEQLGVSSEEIKALMEEIGSKIDLKKASSPEEAIAIIMNYLITRLTKKAIEQEEDKKKVEKKKEALQKEIEKRMIYQFYKIINPHHLAGNHNLQDFFKKLVHHGAKLSLEIDHGHVKMAIHHHGRRSDSHTHHGFLDMAKHEATARSK